MKKKINLNDKLKKIAEHWSPKVVAEMNNYQFKLAKIKGEFIWHTHKDTDEAFIIIKGSMKIYFRDREIDLAEGDMYVVPAGVEHKPYSEKECQIMLVEPKGVINTGDKVSDLTASNDLWI